MLKKLAVLSLMILAGCASPKVASPTLPAIHTVMPGETIATIAEKYYGQRQAEGYQAILKANPQIKDAAARGNALVLTIPKLDVEGGDTKGETEK